MKQKDTGAVKTGNREDDEELAGWLIRASDNLEEAAVELLKRGSGRQS